MTAGVYIHYPYCIKKCNYCDFVSYPIHESSYTIESAIAFELNERLNNKFADFVYDTIYFGGGTPSLIEEEDLTSLMSVLFDTDEESITLHFAKDKEITMEANPETVNYRRASLWYHLGFNRISLGGQSFDDSVLSLSGRIHKANKITEAYRILRDIGYQNINIDLILGLPGETNQTMDINLEMIEKLNPDHLSIYFLTVSEHTKLFQQITQEGLELPPEEIVIERWGQYVKYLSSLGYIHYEISNFCKPGKECRHNLHYWHLDPYLGLGVSAVGFDSDFRYTNSFDIETYYNAQFSKDHILNREFINTTKLKQEKIMLSLRLLQEGVERSLINCDKDVIIQDWIQKGFLVERGKRLLLTEQGVVFSNQVICSLF